MADSSFDSSVSRPSSDVLDFFFLLSSFEVLIAEKKSKPRSVSTIPNHIHLAFRRSNSRLLEFLHPLLSKHTFKNATTEHVFSIAATM